MSQSDQCADVSHSHVLMRCHSPKNNASSTVWTYALQFFKNSIMCGSARSFRGYENAGCQASGPKFIPRTHNRRELN